MAVTIQRTCWVRSGGGGAHAYAAVYDDQRGWMVRAPGHTHWVAPPRPLTTWRDVERLARAHYMAQRAKDQRADARNLELRTTRAAIAAHLAAEARRTVLANGGHLPDAMPADQQPYALNVIRVLRSAERDVALAQEVLNSRRDLPERNRRLLQLRVDHPHASMKELAALGGTTKDSINGLFRRTFGAARLAPSTIAQKSAVA